MQIKMQTDNFTDRLTGKQKYLQKQTDRPTGQLADIFTLLTINNNKNK